MDELLPGEDTAPPTAEEWAAFMSAVRAMGERAAEQAEQEGQAAA